MKKCITQYFLLFTCAVMTAGGCKKITSLDSPQNQLTTDKVFEDENSAEAATVNLYSVLEKSQYPAYNKYIGCYTDECTSLNDDQWNQSLVPASDGVNQNDWTYLYAVIYQANNLLEQLPGSKKIPAATASLFTGEAYFMRAYAYLYLVNLYGDVPLITGTDVNSNRQAARASETAVYQQILSDLQQAKTLLPETYRGAGKVRANKWAAAALLARVYLYRKSWSLAEAEAGAVIGSGVYGPLDNPGDVFKAGSKESILQLWTEHGYTTDNLDMVPETDGSSPNYPLTTSLVGTFEAGDLRQKNWIGTSNVVVNNASVPFYYCYKYKNRDQGGDAPEYLMVLRLSEQYLIRAESRAEQGKISGPDGAAADLNLIRSRAGLPATTAADLPAMRIAIAQENRVEFFLEWGHRFPDLKRTGALDVVMNKAKPGWRSTNNLLPLPLTEVTYDKNLIQNPGY